MKDIGEHVWFWPCVKLIFEIGCNIVLFCHYCWRGRFLVSAVLFQNEITKLRLPAPIIVLVAINISHKFGIDWYDIIWCILKVDEFLGFNWFNWIYWCFKIFLTNFPHDWIFLIFLFVAFKFNQSSKEIYFDRHKFLRLTQEFHFYF